MRLYLAVDRQDYVINWTNQADRRNVTLHAAGSADDNTGYVFGMHLDFDSGMDGQSVEADAVATGDYAKPYAFRRYARVWLQEDYSDALRQYWKTRKRKQRQAAKNSSSPLVASIQTTYDAAANRGDVEQAATMDFDTQLPLRGMQTHSEYTLYGHFFYLERMLRGVEKVRFFMDQESAIRAACLGAFRERVTERTVDAFYVRIDKSLTVNERRYAIAQSRAEFDAAKVRYPGLSESEVEVKVILRVLPEQAPHMVARIGTIDNLIEHVVHPLIDSSFRNQSSSSEAMKFMQDRHEEQRKAGEHIVAELRRYHVECVSVLICQIVLPERLMQTLTNKVVAAQLDSRHRPCNFVEIMPRLEEHLKRK